MYDEEEKDYSEQEEPTLHQDNETGEWYIINPAGTRIAVEGEE